MAAAHRFQRSNLARRLYVAWFAYAVSKALAWGFYVAWFGSNLLYQAYVVCATSYAMLRIFMMEHTKALLVWGRETFSWTLLWAPVEYVKSRWRECIDPVAAPVVQLAVWLLPKDIEPEVTKMILFFGFVACLVNFLGTKLCLACLLCLASERVFTLIL